MANKEFEVEHPEHHQMKIIDTTGNISLPVSTSGFHFRLPLSETRMNIENQPFTWKLSLKEFVFVED